MSDLDVLAEGLDVFRARRPRGAVLSDDAAAVIRIHLRRHGWHYQPTTSADVLARRVHHARRLAGAHPQTNPPSTGATP